MSDNTRNSWVRPTGTSLSSAKIEDVNIDSLYGSCLKLDGIKLLVGNDIVNVYRMTNAWDIYRPKVKDPFSVQPPCPSSFAT